MIIPPEVDIANIYDHTTVILGTATLIMGITLLVLSRVLKHNGIRSQIGLKFIATAMFVLSLVNSWEYICGTDIQNERNSLSIVVFTASTQLFLLFMAYMSMLCKDFLISRRIYIEIGCIILFTTPALFFSSTALLYNVLFTISIIFYCVKFICNYIEFRKQIKITKTRVKNTFSDDSNLWLEWINSTFYVVLSVGLISIIAPMTNVAALIIYNSYVIVAYFYVYLLIIKKISVFDKSMELLENNETQSSDNESVEEPITTPEAYPQPVSNFMAPRMQLLDDWIAHRGYAVTGITATEVAKVLKTNRTRLSSYLKNDLNITYYDWIAQLRIEDAKQQLIVHPDRAICEIALNVGIEDRDNFRHLFKKIVGVSPTVYRKHNGYINHII